MRSKVTRALCAACGAGLLAAATLTAVAEPSSPLAEYPGFGHYPDRDEERFTAEESEREDLIAGCMKARGFRYVPAPSVVVTGAETEPPSVKDPNDAYVRGLSPAERAAYYLALTGVPDPFDEGLQPSPGSADPGCVAKALEAVPGVYAARQALAEEVDEMEQAIATDPRVSAAVDGWSRCMAEKGFRYSSPAALEASLDEAVGSMLDARDWDPLALTEVVAGREPAVRASESCDDGLRTTMTAVRAELEGAFVDEHRSVLDAYSSKG